MRCINSKQRWIPVFASKRLPVEIGFLSKIPANHAALHHMLATPSMSLGLSPPEFNPWNLDHLRRGQFGMNSSTQLVLSTQWPAKTGTTMLRSYGKMFHRARVQKHCRQAKLIKNTILDGCSTISWVWVGLACFDIALASFQTVSSMSTSFQLF